MNKIKIKETILDIANVFDKNGLSIQEKYAVFANMLISSALDKDANVIGYPDVDWKDAFQVERELISQGGSDHNLAAILQGHVILKWANLIEESS